MLGRLSLLAGRCGHCRAAAGLQAPTEPGLVSGLRGLACGVTAGVTGIVSAPAAGMMQTCFVLMTLHHLTSPAVLVAHIVNNMLVHARVASWKGSKVSNRAGVHVRVAP
jgi:hypothetical protein